MKNIGLIGAESKHADFFGTLFNVDARFQGYRVNALWGGDAPDKVPELAGKLGIANICDSIEEVIDISDAVMVIQRRGSAHYKAAMLALQARKPVFVDKPFVSETRQAEALVDFSARIGVPIFGGSTLKYLPQIYQIKDVMAREKADTIMIRYPADPQSIYDGFWYYGSHLAELCVTLCGTEYSRVKAVKNGDGVIASVVYPNVKAVISSAPGHSGLHICLLGASVRHFEVDETECYYHGMAGFVNMLNTHQPPTDGRHFIASTELLADIVRSYNE
jgi:predicted dehydrogenase